MSTPPKPSGAEAPGPASDDRARKVRLPSLPELPSAGGRPEWQSHVRPGPEQPGAASPTSGRPDAAAPESLTAQPAIAPERTGSALPDWATVRLEQPPPEDLARRPDTLASEPTDTLSSPSRERQQTLAFDAPAGGSPGPAAVGSPFPDFAAPDPSGPRPAPVPSYPPPSTGAPTYGSPVNRTRPAPTRSRRWPWVVLLLLPILVIAISGWLLFLLLGA